MEAGTWGRGEGGTRNVGREKALLSMIGSVPPEKLLGRFQ